MPLDKYVLWGELPKNCANSVLGLTFLIAATQVTA